MNEQLGCHAVASGAEPHGPFFGGGVCGVLGGLWGVACDRVVDGGVQCGAAGPVAAGKGPGEAADDIGLDGADETGYAALTWQLAVSASDFSSPWRS